MEPYPFYHPVLIGAFADIFFQPGLVIGSEGVLAVLKDLFAPFGVGDPAVLAVVARTVVALAVALAAVVVAGP